MTYSTGFLSYELKAVFFSFLFSYDLSAWWYRFKILRISKISRVFILLRSSCFLIFIFFLSIRTNTLNLASTEKGYPRHLHMFGYSFGISPCEDEAVRMGSWGYR